MGAGEHQLTVGPMRLAVCDENDERTAMLACAISRRWEGMMTVEGFADEGSLLRRLGEAGYRCWMLVYALRLTDSDAPVLRTRLDAAGFSGRLVIAADSMRLFLPAYDIGACGYLLKGSDDEAERLERIVSRELEATVSQEAARVEMRNARETMSVALGEISHFEVRRHEVTAHLVGARSFRFTGSLREIEARLYPAFVRVHNSYIANVAHIRSFTTRELRLAQGVVLPVSRKYLSGLRSAVLAMTAYHFGSSKGRKA